MTRMGLCIGLKPEVIARYKEVHAAVWPEVLAAITAANIGNYSIFLREPENLLFAYWEYTGEDFDADMELMKQNPSMREWWTICDPLQQPLETRAPGEWWARMEPVFFHA
ncbi:L-rhamnose mutarotase [Mesorhizobium sp.]|uniref:L-rhamnose mutarotase n=1 Tax=Mesorhizobium sp. TaxID=1871066 RepID=UPI003BABFB14